MDGSWVQSKHLAEVCPGTLCGLPSGQAWLEQATPSHPLAGGHRWQDRGWKVLSGRGPAAARGGGRGRDLDRRGPHRPSGAAHTSVQGHHHPPGEAWGGAGRDGRCGWAQL